MKKLLFFLFTITATAQESYQYASVAIDVRNGIVGSNPTNNTPELDLLFQAGLVGDNWEVNIVYESFKAIHFDKYSIGVGYHIPLYGRIGNKVIKTILIPSIEPSLIGRWGQEWGTTSSHLAIGGNISLRWFLSDKIAVEWLINGLTRTDLKAGYPELHKTVPIIGSNYFKVIFIF